MAQEGPVFSQAAIEFAGRPLGHALLPQLAPASQPLVWLHASNLPPTGGRAGRSKD